jgi:signal transduction histidine kinase/CheY-like chemotaxis protein
MANQTKFIFTLGVILGFFLYYLGQHYQTKALQDRFQHEVKQSKTILEGKLEINKNILEGIGSLFNASQVVTRDEFNVFVDPLLKHNKFIQALSWVPRISDDQRVKFENLAKKDGFPNFQITERNKQGVMVRAGIRPEYYPVFFIGPYIGNEAAQGFDLASNPIRQKSLKMAIDYGKPVATSKINLVQGNDNQAGFLILFPIYQNYIIPATLEERREKLIGIISGVYRIEDMIHEIIDSHFNEEINLVIFEGKKLDPQFLLFGNFLKNISFEFQEPFLIEGKTWTLFWQANKDFKEFNSKFPVMVGSGSFFIFVLLAIIFQMNHSKTRKKELEIQDRIRVEEKLIHLKNEAERANDAKSEFLSRMSHELRTPLNAILGFGQLMQADTEESLTSSHDDNLQEIMKGGNHLLNLINELLDLAQIESGNQTMTIENVRLNHIFEETLSLMFPLAQEKNIIIENRITEKVWVLADRTKLKQVLLNLLSNAVKYTPNSGSVNISQQGTSDGFIHITIKDTGPGLNKNQQKLIFEPFKRLDADKYTIDGAGIGLTIAQQFLNLMEGDIEVKSILNEGSSFIIKIPKGKEMPGKKDLSHLTPKSIDTGKRRNEFTLLYVEDNPKNLLLVQRILKKREDIQVLAAPHAEAGIELARKHLPDLILMDINLPGLSGIEAFKLLRSYEETKKIPIIAISALAMEADINTALDLGFQAYITKPFDMKNLMQEINRYLIKDFVLLN